MRLFIILCCLWLAASARAAEPIRHLSFPSAEAAVEALASAIAKDDRNAAAAVLGDKGMRIVRSGDTVIDASERGAFLRLFRERNAVEPESESRAMLLLGEEEYPFPVPLVARGGRWRFDAIDGHEDLLSRRIGRTERIALDVLMAVAKAQHQYFDEVRQADGIQRYTHLLVGDPGRRDGLSWPDGQGKFVGPLGAFATVAIAEGYRAGYGIYRGYRYRSLDTQGPHAPGGVRSYVVDGRRSQGFAVLACPVRYAVSGVLSFMVSQDGVVYHKDLGPKTTDRCKAMKKFDPDRSWTRGAGA